MNIYDYLSGKNDQSSRPKIRVPNSGLESRIGSMTKSENFIAKAFTVAGFRYSYEDPLYVEKYIPNKDKKIGLLFHPDFHLQDYGIVVEYAGRYPGETEESYRKRIREKNEIYRKNNTPVVWIYPGDIWKEDFSGIRPDAYQNVISKVNQAIQYGRTTPLNEGEIDTYLSNSSSAKYAA